MRCAEDIRVRPLSLYIYELQYVCLLITVNIKIANVSFLIMRKNSKMVTLHMTYAETAWLLITLINIITLVRYFDVDAALMLDHAARVT